MKTPPIIPQSFIDKTVEHILLTEEHSHDEDHAWPTVWALSSGQEVAITDLPRRHLHQIGHGDINQRWREILYQQKRNAGRKYFGTPSEMVPAPLLTLDDVDITLTEENLTTAAQPEVSVAGLEQKIRFLEMQLESHRPYLQLYRLGAGSLLVAVLSLVVWLLTGTGIPFHPIFAIAVIPAAVGVILMAFLIRSSSKTPKRN